MIITISGKAGSGKSTIATELAKKLGYKHYSSGDFQRELAKERGLTIEEWGELQKTDKKYDQMVDDKMVEFGQRNKDAVIDGWLAANFIPHGFKVFLDVSLDEALKRRINQKRDTESFDDIEEAKRSLLQRSETNRQRWIEYYGYDYLELDNYDLVIDTTNLDPEKIVNKILDALDTRH